MEARIADLKNNLSRFLKRMSESGEPITVLDRNTPIAKITPIRSKGRSVKSNWQAESDSLRARAKKAGVKLAVTSVEPKPLRLLAVVPQVAPDGRRDINTVAAMRAEKEY